MTEETEPTGVAIHNTNINGEPLDSGVYFVQYTIVPDSFFDEWMTQLSSTELRVMLYIYRRTLGFNKMADPISLNQFLHGIRKRNGEQLDYGCGVKNRSALLKALRRLEELNLIRSFKRRNSAGDNEVTLYHVFPKLLKKKNSAAT